MKLFTPGPVEVPKRVLDAMNRAIIHHRSEVFHQIFEDVVRMLKKVADHDGYVAILSGSGTTAVDAMVWSVIGRNENVVVITSGEFGNRVADTLRRRGAKVHTIDIDPTGTEIEIEELFSHIEKLKPSTVVVVHTETSKGFTFRDLDRLARVCRSLGAKLLVDAVSSFGGEELSMRWGIDGIATASHKALAAPPGIAIVMVSNSVIEDIEKNSRDVPLLLDLKKYIDFSHRNETPFTPCIPVLYALREALNIILEKGIENYIAEHSLRASILYKEAQRLGLEPLVKSERYRSSTVVALRTPINAIEIKKCMERLGYVIATGIGKDKEFLIRIGTMGCITVEDLRGLVSALRECLEWLSR